MSILISEFCGFSQFPLHQAYSMSIPLGINLIYPFQSSQMQWKSTMWDFPIIASHTFNPTLVSKKMDGFCNWTKNECLSRTDISFFSGLATCLRPLPAFLQPLRKPQNQQRVIIFTANLYNPLKGFLSFTHNCSSCKQKHRIFNFLQCLKPSTNIPPMSILIQQRHETYVQVCDGKKCNLVLPKDKLRIFPHMRFSKRIPLDVATPL